MHIGFDLDKILINHPPLIPSWLINQLYGESVNGHLSYRIPGKLEQIIRKLSHNSLLRQPIRYNLNLLRQKKGLKNQQLFLISSRYSFLKKETDKIIKSNNLRSIFTKMIFNYNNQQPHKFKDAMISREHIDRFVDDDLPLLQFLAPRHPKTLFFWLNPKRNDKLKTNLYAITQLTSVFERL